MEAFGKATLCSPFFTELAYTLWPDVWECLENCAGHDHDGGYAVDEMGVHHMVPAAPLECVVGEDAFGHVEVLPDDRGLRVVWSGKLPVKGQWPEILECPPLDSNLQLASSL